MGRRYLQSAGALFPAVATAAVLTVSVAGQAQKPAPKSPAGSDEAPAAQALSKAKASTKTQNYKTPRTAWGEPDLQGVWSYATTTPLSKPDSAGDKTLLTDDEVAQ